MTTFVEKEFSTLPESGLDLVLFGQRLRHIRKTRGLTLAELGERVGRAPSVLSLLENGRREPKLSQIDALASALGVSSDDLMRREAPSRLAQLEIALDEAQRDPIYASRRLPYLRPCPRLPSDGSQHVLSLHEEVRRQQSHATAT